MEKQPNSRMCFACGIENPVGLKLKFYTDDDGWCIARFRPKLDVPTQISMHADPLSV